MGLKKEYMWVEKKVLLWVEKQKVHVGWKKSGSLSRKTRAKVLSRSQGSPTTYIAAGRLDSQDNSL